MYVLGECPSYDYSWSSSVFGRCGLLRNDALFGIPLKFESINEAVFGPIEMLIFENFHSKSIDIEKDCFGLIIIGKY